ncbi:25825_t:CDS:2, partial [Dentiscutata erythropus]
FERFLIPDTPLQLINLSNIIKIILNLKYHVIKLHCLVESNCQKDFKRGGIQHIDDSAVFSSDK